MHMKPFIHDAYKEAYTKDEDFKDVFQQLHGQIRVEKGDGKDDYHLQNGVALQFRQALCFKGEIL
jgi:hypothetical protein